MLALKILSGLQSGQTFILEQGSYKFGRSVTSSFQFLDASISKNHLEIMVHDTKFVLRDLGSANGTFVNGVRVQGSVLQIGDEVSIGDVRCLIVPVETRKVITTRRVQTHVQAVPLLNSAVSPPPLDTGLLENESPVTAAPLRLESKVDRFKEIFFPGIFQLIEVFDFKYVLAGFLAVYVLMVTVLSAIPMKYISSESVAAESRRRSLSLARAFAQRNLAVAQSQDSTLFQAESVIREEGVEDYYILSQDGSILAPPERVGSFPKESGFSKKVRGQPREFSDELSNGKIISAVPLLVFDPETQTNSAKAHAIIIYDSGALKFDDGRALSLFIQILFISGLLGSLLFIIFSAIIDQPLSVLNRSLDIALREQSTQITSNIRHPKLQLLIMNINSLLTRLQQNQPIDVSHGNREGLQRQDLERMVEIVGFPALLMNRNYDIQGANSVFQNMFGSQINAQSGLTIDALSDSAFQQNISALVQKCEQDSLESAFDHLEISGQLLRINCQAFRGTDGSILHILIVLTPPEEGSVVGGAA